MLFNHALWQTFIYICTYYLHILDFCFFRWYVNFDWCVIRIYLSKWKQFRACWAILGHIGLQWIQTTKREKRTFGVFEDERRKKKKKRKKKSTNFIKDHLKFLFFCSYVVFNFKKCNLGLVAFTFTPYLVYLF